MIKLDVMTTLKDLRGIEMKEDEKSVIVKDVITSSVLYVEKDKHLTPDEKYKLYKISRKVYDAEGEIELDDSEIATIKESVGLLYAPIIVGQVFELLGL